MSLSTLPEALLERWFAKDEVFRLIALDGAVAPSVIDVVEHAVVIGDMTKPWGLGGLRVGWIARRNQALLKLVSAARDYSSICGNAPGEFLAEVTLRHRERVMAPRLAAARVNRQRLADAFQGLMQHWHVIDLVVCLGHMDYR